MTTDADASRSHIWVYRYGGEADDDLLDVVLHRYAAYTGNADQITRDYPIAYGTTARRALRNGFRWVRDNYGSPTAGPPLLREPVPPLHNIR